MADELYDDYSFHRRTFRDLGFVKITCYALEVGGIGVLALDKSESWIGIALYAGGRIINDKINERRTRERSEMEKLLVTNPEFKKRFETESISSVPHP
ncbi:hypothetical protein J4217_00220 [Candidatus Pacearchaeota archaeon]|nr:hypothetical protein [Candidatus Pacearchaeota archaeon]